MNKCVRIICNIPEGDFLHDIVQKQARKLGIEGTAQQSGTDKIKIIACGPKEAVDNFVDIMHKELNKQKIDDIEIEPFLKDKDYRAVFRIIE